VPRAQLQNAVNLNTLPHRLAVLIGPAVAGFLIARVSGPAAYVAVAALQAFALVLLTTIRVPPGAPRPRSSLAELAVGGLRYTVRSRLLPALLFLELVMLLFGYGAVLLTVFARDVLRAGPEGLGVLYGAAGAGAILASAGLIATGDIERKGRLLFAAAGAYAVAFLAFAGSSLLALSVGLMFVAGAAEALWGAMRQSILQLVIEDAYRGRVMSLLVIGFNGVTQVGQLTIGFLIAAFGAPAAGAFGALAVGAAVVTVAVRRPELRRFTGTGEERVSGVEAAIETSIPAT
jgi:predicted MFS family arabinose efflux permease